MREVSVIEVPRWIRHPSGQWAVAFQLSFCRFSFVFVVFLSPRFAFFAAFVLFVAVLFVSFRFSSFVVFVAVSFVRFSFLFFSFPFVPFVASRRQLQSNVRFIDEFVTYKLPIASYNRYPTAKVP